VTGPLAPLFAQLEQAVEDAFRIELDECCTGPKYEASLKQQRDERLAALSVIERHVQDMEKALRGGVRIASQYLDTDRGDLDGWVDSATTVLAALPASGAPEGVAREKGTE
jgi:hypothetical protein